MCNTVHILRRCNVLNPIEKFKVTILKPEYGLESLIYKFQVIPGNSGIISNYPSSKEIICSGIILYLFSFSVSTRRIL